MKNNIEVKIIILDNYVIMTEQKNESYLYLNFKV